MAGEMLGVLSDVVEAARRQGADQADAVFVDGRSLSVSWRLGKLERLERQESSDIGLRVLIGKRQAMVSTADHSAAGLRAVVERAVAMARTVPEDPFCGLADPADLARHTPALDIYDPTEPTAEELIKRAQRAEQAARAVAGVINSEGAEAGWGMSRIALVASNGFAHAYDVSSSSFSVSVLAGDPQTGMERDYDYSSAVYATDLQSPEEIGANAGRWAVRRCGARKVKTCSVPVVFDPRVARGVVGHFLSAINGASIARGTSFLQNSLGQKVFPAGLAIIDDPHRPRGLRSRPCDGEGLPTQKRSLIDDGVLTTWILDLRSARQLGLSSTGHAARGTSSPPSPSASNVYLAAGHISPQDLIKDIREGFYVTDLFGMGVNGLTGDYSRGAAGFWIENGEIAYPVSEVTIAGNLKDMFLNLTPADDLILRHGIDAPTIRIDGMTIAGQ